MAAAPFPKGWRDGDGVAVEPFTLDAGGVRIVGNVMGNGVPVLMIPSLGRSADDFLVLASMLALAGRMAILPEPRGIGGSTGLAPETLADLADDAAAVIDHFGGQADVIGHAFGQRVARMLAARCPDKVKSLVLLAAGGHKEMPEEVRASLIACVSEGGVDDVMRAKALQHVFFARGNDGRAWLSGWWPAAAQAQIAAVRATDTSVWWGGGKSEILVVQANEDPIAPLANTDALVTEGGDRIRVVHLKHASHAILPEQPEAVANAVQAYLGGERDTRVLQSVVDRAVRTPAEFAHG